MPSLLILQHEVQIKIQALYFLLFYPLYRLFGEHDDRDSRRASERLLRAGNHNVGMYFLHGEGIRQKGRHRIANKEEIIFPTKFSEHFRIIQNAGRSFSHVHKEPGKTLSIILIQALFCQFLAEFEFQGNSGNLMNPAQICKSLSKTSAVDNQEFIFLGKTVHHHRFHRTRAGTGHKYSTGSLSRFTIF